MKFILLLILGVYAFQGFEARSTVEFQRTQDIIDDIFKMIKKYQDLLGDVIADMQTVAKNYKDLSDNLQNDAQTAQKGITQLIDDTDDKIRDIVNSGDKGKQCVEEHQQDIDDWVKKINETIANCATNANAGLEQIQNTIQNWTNDTVSFLRNTQQTLTSCTKKQTPEDKLACLQDNYSAAAAKYNKLDQSGNDILSTINTQGPVITDNFQQCAKNTISDATSQARKLINTINDCVAN